MKWTKPSGSQIETNDDAATIKYCESLGWKRAKKMVKKTVKKAVKK